MLRKTFTLFLLIFYIYNKVCRDNHIINKPPYYSSKGELQVYPFN